MSLLEVLLFVFGAALILVAVAIGMRICRAKLDAEAELAYLGGRLLEVQETERNRVAAEVHEGMRQQLALVAFNLEGIQVQFSGSAEQRAELMLLARRVRGISEELREVTHQLPPGPVQHLCLVAVETALKINDRESMSRRAKQFGASVVRHLTGQVWRRVRGYPSLALSSPAPAEKAEAQRQSNARSVGDSPARLASDSHSQRSKKDLSSPRSQAPPSPYHLRRSQSPEASAARTALQLLLPGHRTETLPAPVPQ